LLHLSNATHPADGCGYRGGAASAASLKVSGDPRGAKGVAADPALHAELGRAALNHAPGVDAVHHG
jgi:hypothetical protein